MDFSTTISLTIADDLRDLFNSLDEPSFDADRSLAALRKDLKLIIRSSLGFTLRLGGSQPVTLTSVDYFIRPDDIVSSLSVPLSWVSPDEVGSSIVFYAGVPGALVDLSADLAYALSLPLDSLSLDADLAPEFLRSGIAGLAEASTVNRAIGMLMGRGCTVMTAQAELGRMADDSSQSIQQSAAGLLLAINAPLDLVAATGRLYSSTTT